MVGLIGFIMVLHGCDDHTDVGMLWWIAGLYLMFKD
jgi:hypothetical protein